MLTTDCWEFCFWSLSWGPVAISWKVKMGYIDSTRRNSNLMYRQSSKSLVSRRPGKKASWLIALASQSLDKSTESHEARGGGNCGGWLSLYREESFSTSICRTKMLLYVPIHVRIYIYIYNKKTEYTRVSSVGRNRNRARRAYGWWRWFSHLCPVIQPECARATCCLCWGFASFVALGSENLNRSWFSLLIGGRHGLRANRCLFPLSVTSMSIL